MRLIKRLDLYILKKFLPLFVGAFCICLFVFMMQFTWRYIDELIGKGLSLDILAQFFWYMAITLVPTALPLAVLLASLITFGNMGEQLELLSMRAAGVPLLRIMRPIMVLVVALTGISFYFQNKTSPEAQINLRTLLISMKQAQPAVEIPEGVFYNEIPNYNLYVKKKNAATGMLYDVIIYKTDQGFERQQIVLADSGRLEMSADKLHLKLDLWQGAQFGDPPMQNTMGQAQTTSPFNRETFGYKQFLIDFDSNFALMDQALLRNMPQAKSMREIEQSVDSMQRGLDSIGHRNYEEARERWYAMPALLPADSARLAKKTLPFDTLLARTDATARHNARQMAMRTIRSAQSELEWKSQNVKEEYNLVRRHQVEWHQKMTLSLACLLFFFIGAPLGAIIRKGGLGLPAVVSVFIFIFYYAINTAGMKQARDGSLDMIVGMWVSSAVLLPFGIFLTYKSNKDSVVFNAEVYVAVIFRLLGLRNSRHLARKEVVIDRPDNVLMLAEADRLRSACRDYANSHKLYMAPSYLRIFFRPRPDHQVAQINATLEAIVEQLSNSRNNRVIALLNRFPIIYVNAHTSPFERRWTSALAGLFFPLGCLLWLRIWRFRLRLWRDMKTIVATCDRLEATLRQIISEENAPAAHSLSAELEPEVVRVKKADKFKHWLKWLALIVLAFAAGWYAYRYFKRQARRQPAPVEQSVPTPKPTEVSAPQSTGHSATERKSDEPSEGLRRMQQLSAPERTASPFR